MLASSYPLTCGCSLLSPGKYLYWKWAIDLWDQDRLVDTEGIVDLESLLPPEVLKSCSVEGEKQKHVIIEDDGLCILV